MIILNRHVTYDKIKKSLNISRTCMIQFYMEKVCVHWLPYNLTHVRMLPSKNANKISTDSTSKPLNNVYGFVIGEENLDLFIGT